MVLTFRRSYLWKLLWHRQTISKKKAHKIKNNNLFLSFHSDRFFGDFSVYFLHHGRKWISWPTFEDVRKVFFPFITEQIAHRLLPLDAFDDLFGQQWSYRRSILVHDAIDIRINRNPRVGNPKVKKFEFTALTFAKNIWVDINIPIVYNRNHNPIHIILAELFFSMANN